MANERKTVATYKGDGSQKVFAFPMDYLKKSFIKVMLDGVPLTYGTDYTVVGKQVEFTVAPAVDVIIVIYRETQTDRMVSWEDASVLRAADMTLFEMQLLHIAEETSDKVQDAGMARDELDNIWDARYTRIKNVEDPVYNTDVVNKRYFESIQAGYIQANTDLVNEAIVQKNQATAQAQAAALSASAANTAKLGAEAAKADLDTAVTTASGSAQTATTKATEAAASANTAGTKATEAGTSAASALEQANRVEQLVTSKTIPVPCMPVGAPFFWPSAAARPDGTLICDGSTFNTTTYPELAKVYTNGVLPDMRGVVPRGLDRGRGLDSEPTRLTGSYQSDLIINHSHYRNQSHLIEMGLYKNSGSNTVAGGSYTWNELGSITGGVYEGSGAETRVKNIAGDWLVYVAPLVYDVNVQNANALTLGGYPASYFGTAADVASRPTIETWEASDGNSWYRKYSDGWIEQGGAFVKAVSGDCSVTFPVAFTVVRSALISPMYSSEVANHETIKAVTTTTLTVTSANNSPAYKVRWEAKGRWK